jgi:hypothetical protein
MAEPPQREIWYRRRRVGLLKYGYHTYPVHWIGTASRAAYFLACAGVVIGVHALKLPYERLATMIGFAILYIPFYFVEQGHYESDGRDDSGKR